jgi:hypothetical protein
VHAAGSWVRVEVAAGGEVSEAECERGEWARCYRAAHHRASSRATGSLYAGAIATWLHWHDQTVGSHWHDQMLN